VRHEDDDLFLAPQSRLLPHSFLDAFDSVLAVHGEHLLVPSEPNQTERLGLPFTKRNVLDG
jgi:hypothetical protein